MNKIIKPAVAELIGTFALTFIGAGAVVMAVQGKSNLIGVALAHGIVLMVMIYALGHISGAHVNPAVSVGAFVARKIDAPTLVVYILAQLVGAAVAGFLLASLVPGAVASGLGATDLDKSVSFLQGTVIEAILTFFLVLTVISTAFDPRAPRGIYGIAIGFVLTFDILMGGPLTGASMNPARSFGPALAAGHWDNFLVYIIGPVIGGILGAALYEYFFAKE